MAHYPLSIPDLKCKNGGQTQHISPSDMISNDSSILYGSSEHLKDTKTQFECLVEEEQETHRKGCVDSKYETVTGSLPANGSTPIMCEYCTITCDNEAELLKHYQTESHQNVVMSDGGKDWK